MFNLVSRQDFFDIAVKIERKGLRLPRPGLKNQIRRKWNTDSSVAGSFWDFPWLEKQWNLEVTGNSDIGYRYWLAESFCKQSADALSVGCGDGSAEEKWFQTGLFYTLTGLDIAEQRIQRAKEKYSGLSPGLSFIAGDFLTGSFKNYPVLIFEHAFHHLFPMKEVVRQLKELLKPGDVILMVDYFGPNRFQWEPALIKETNDILSGWPAEWKRIPGTSLTKTKVNAPGLLRMKWSDPSEAAESYGSLDLLRSNFNSLFEKNLSGTLLHLVFKDIAGNFFGPETEPAVKMVLQREKELVESGRVDCHFKAVVFQVPV